MEQPESVEKERSAFLTMLMRSSMHDLNNILSPILGYPELLMGSFDEGSQEREDLLEVKNLAERAISLVRDIQLLIRPELNSLAPCRLDEQIRSIFSSEALRAEVCRVVGACEIILDVPGSLPCVHSSRNVLDALLRNLLSAALLIGGDQAFFRILARKEGDQVVLRITLPIQKIDEGEEYRLREPFFIKKRFSSELTGLELTVAEELIAQHHGLFEVKIRNGELHLICGLPVFSESGDL